MNSRIQRLEAFQTGAQYVLTSTAIALTGIIGSRYALLPEHRGLSGLLIALVLLAVAHLLFLLTKNIAFNSKIIRKWILRDQYFEGVWIDVVHDEPKHYAIVHIRFIGGIYEISGESYDEDANFLGNWMSTSSWASNNRLRYSYRGDVNNLSVWEYDGLTEYNFIGSESGNPTTFTGYYVDLTREPLRKRVTGERLPASDSSQLDRLANRKQFVLEWSRNLQ